MLAQAPLRLMNEIDSYRDNYWCGDPPTTMSGPMWNGEGDEDKDKSQIIGPGFPESIRAAWHAPTCRSQSLGTAPNYLCRMAIEWTEKNPADPRSPEALHLAVGLPVTVYR